MLKRQWSIAIPLAAFLAGSTAWGSSVRDEGRIFSPRAVEEAQRKLERIEQTTRVPTVIETIDHLPNVQGESEKERRETLTRLAVERDKKIRDPGIYILISKHDRLISEPLVREHLADVVSLDRRHAIRKAFLEGFGKKDFDGGLMQGVEEIGRTLEGYTDANRRAGARAGAPVPVGGGVHRGALGGGGFMSKLLMIGLGIFAVLIILRLLGGLFGRSAGAGYPGQMGMGGPRPGMGPGGPGYYGGGGYGGGGRGGGFFSGLLGGLGGAMAGNWLYDQMSGRHGGTTSAGAGLPGEGASSLPDAGDERIVGADDDGGQAASWGDGGGDTGGGDWGGGDAGGDWGGGGGGDWGGGGGDWGGGGDGGGGGDW